MNFVQFSRLIKTSVPNIIVLEGDDIFLIEKALGLITENCQITLKDMDISFYDSENYNINTVLNSCEQMPFSSKFRLVVLKNINKLNESEKIKFKKYSQNPNKTTCLVFIAENLKEDYTFLNIDKVNCSKLDDVYIQKFITGEFDKNKIKITSDAILKLMDFTDRKLSLIYIELQKLISVQKEDDLIDDKMIEQHVNKEGEYQIFELTEAISQKDVDKSISIIKGLLAKKEDPQSIFGFLASNFRRIFFVSISDQTDSQLALKFGVKEFAIKKARMISKKFTALKLKQINELFVETDYMVKNGEIPFESALYFLVYKIIR